MRTPTLLLLIIEAICIGHTLSVAPGFKLRLTQNGLNYANKVANGYLDKTLRNMRIPDQHGSRWSLTNIRIKGVNVPRSHMAFDPAHNGLTWTVSNFGIDLDADWMVKYKIFWRWVKSRGGVRASIKGVNLKVTIGLDQSGGRPTLSMARCHASVGHVKVHFYKHLLSFIINWFKGLIGRKIRDNMQRELCNVVRKVINNQGNQQLRKIKVNVDMNKRFLLDYQLVRRPSVQSNNLELHHKGEIFLKSDMREAPFSPKPFPSANANSRMAYLWLSEYVANTYAYNAQKHGILHYRITAQNLLPNKRGLLNTTCSGYCIGSFLPEVAKKYPNSYVEAGVKSTKMPHVTITPRSIRIALEGEAGIYVKTPNRQSHSLFTIGTKLSLAVAVSVVNERLIGKVVGNPSISVWLIKTGGGINQSLPSEKLTRTIQLGLQTFIIPELNFLLKQGIEVPETGSLSFYNTGLKLVNGAVLIYTDVKTKL